MTAATTTMAPSGGAGEAAKRFVRRNGWVLTLWAVLGVMFLITKLFIKEDYGAAAVGILVLSALPYAYATAGQTMAIIAGGIDLSMAAMMTLLSVSAAVLMDGQSEEFGFIAVPLILLLGLAVGSVNGLAVVFTRVPDIVVTLSFFFIWEGVALLVLEAPGGSISMWLKELIIGTVGGAFIPDIVSDWAFKALILLVVTLGVVWIPLKRSRPGLALYAIGSDKRAAQRSGVPVNRTKVFSYALAGL